MNEVVIRNAVFNDLDTLLRLEQMLIEEERTFDETLEPVNAFYYDFDEMMSNAGVKLIVAEINQEIIGTGYARIRDAAPFLNYKKYIYLGFMYVLPSWRNKGVNKKIIERLKQWTISKNISEVRLDVYYENKVAVKAYTKSGFSGHVLEMRLPV